MSKIIISKEKGFNAKSAALSIFESTEKKKDLAVKLMEYLEKEGLKLSSWCKEVFPSYTYEVKQAKTNKEGKQVFYPVSFNKVHKSILNSLAYNEVLQKTDAELKKGLKDKAKAKADKADKEANLLQEAVKKEIEAKGLLSVKPLSSMTMQELKEVFQLVSNEIKARENRQDRKGKARPVMQAGK